MRLGTSPDWRPPSTLLNMVADSSVAQESGEPTVRMAKSLRLVLLLLPPLLLAGLETVHPQPEPTVQAMLEVATWFAIFHAMLLRRRTACGTAVNAANCTVSPG